jgi:hypothetical protein
MADEAEWCKLQGKQDKVGAQARARKPRRRERQRQSRADLAEHDARPSLTTVAVLYSYCKPPRTTPPPLHHSSLLLALPLPLSSTSCTITQPPHHHAGISLQPFRGAAPSYLSCPPVLHTRADNLFLSAALFSLFFSP